MEIPKVSETIFDSKQENLQKLAQLFPDVVKTDSRLPSTQSSTWRI